LERAQLFLSLGHRELQNGRVQTAKMLIMESKKKKKQKNQQQQKKPKTEQDPDGTKWTYFIYLPYIICDA
jgi:hypothetical protein